MKMLAGSMNKDITQPDPVSRICQNQISDFMNGCVKLLKNFN